MNIVWFSWKDSKHPQAGGAEAVTNQILTRLVNDGHSVKLITSRYKGSNKNELLDGIEVHRTGNKLTVYIGAFWYFITKLSKWPDLVVDEMNTIPFGCALYTRKRSMLYTYQLARSVWFYQMWFPFSWLGYVLEPVYLFILSRCYKLVITESQSTRNDLTRFGFDKERIKVIRVGIDLKPVSRLPDEQDQGLVLVLGALRPMKQTLDSVKAFEYARDTKPDIRLILAGDASGAYADKVSAYIAQSRHKDAIQMLGRVTAEEKLRLMRKAALIVVASVKEGWGLIVTEANSQGTVAVAYDTDGLRDSVLDGKTGLLSEAGNPEALGQKIAALLQDAKKRNTMRFEALSYSRQFTHENSYKDFIEAVSN